MIRAISFSVMFLIVGLMGSLLVVTAEASWKSSALMGQNQGYCHDGKQHANIANCPENRANGAVHGKKRAQQSR